jgi:hypothetical protein
VSTILDFSIIPAGQFASPFHKPLYTSDVLLAADILSPSEMG